MEVLLENSIGDRDCVVIFSNSYGNLTQGGCGGNNPHRYACQYNRYALDVIRDDKTSFTINKN